MAQETVKPSYTQRRYLVDKKFQIKYTLLVVVFSALLYGVLAYFLYRKEVANSQILQIQNVVLGKMVESQDMTLLYYLGAFFLLQVASLFLLGILITHRIAGPVHRVQRYLEELADTGDIRSLESVRTRDEFHEFFDTIGRVISTFQAKNESLRNQVSELLAELEQARADPNRFERCKSIGKELLKRLTSSS